MLDVLADLGRASVFFLWVPVLAWTVVAFAVEAGLRLGRAPAALGLPARGATLAALPASVLFPPLLGALAPEAAQAVATATPTLAALPEVVVGASGSPLTVAPGGPEAWAIVLGAVVAGLALGSFVAFGRLAAGLWGTARLRRRPAAPEEVQTRLDAVCRRVGIARPVLAVTAPEGAAPFTVGWSRPVVAVPPGLSGDALDVALVHEAAHVHRADYAWHLAQESVASLLVAHPLVRTLCRRLDLDRERVADAVVLDLRPGARRAYADLLFSYAALPAPALALGAAPGSSSIKLRIDAMTRPLPPHRLRLLGRLGRLGGALTLAAAVGLAVATSAQAPPEPPAPPAPPAAVALPTASIQSVQYRSGDRVEVQLQPGQGETEASRVADLYHDPEAEGRLVVRYDGGVIERIGVRSGLIAPPPPPPAPEAPAPPLPPPPPPEMRGDAPPPPPRGPSLRLGVTRDTTDEVYEVVDEMPQLIGGIAGLQERVVYPDLQRRAGVEGRALIGFVVGEDGTVEDPQVIRSSGNDGLDQAALAAVLPSRFTPGRQGGEAVRVRFVVPITFRLPPDESDGVPD